MTDWKDIIRHLAYDAETHMDTLRYRLHYQLGGLKPVKIVTYNGYGTADQLYLRGRVLEDKHIPEAEKNDKVWENLLNMYKRLESNEVPHARLVARFQGVEQVVSADEEGFFEVWLKPTQPLADNRLWHPVEIELLDPIPEEQAHEPVKAIGQVMVPLPSARFIVISDIDDTVLRSDATHLMRMARNVFLGNAHTRLPFPGVAALYRALFAGVSGSEMNPLLFVSSSPWNLYDLLEQFFHLQEIPGGPVLFLRDWGLSREEMLPLHNHRFKIGVIRQMMEFYPHLPFILIGDSGQEDPEIYAELVQQFPHRVQAVYIRNISRDLQRPDAIHELAKKVLEAGSSLVLANDTLSIAKHAVTQKFITASALPLIGEEKRKDEAPPSPVETLLGEAPEPAAAGPEAPTVKVTQQAVKQDKIEQTIKEVGAEKTSSPPTVVVEGKEKNK